MLLAAVVLGVAGGVVLLLSRLGVARLPGDISVQSGGLTLAFPIVTCIVVSIVLTVVVNVFLSLRH